MQVAIKKDIFTLNNNNLKNTIMTNTQLATQSAAPIFFNPFDREQSAIMREMATDMANSDLVPDMYKISEKTPEKKAVANCMIAMGMALRMQADPLMVMQNMYIVHGRPSWSSKFLIATVNTCGRFSALKYRFTNKGKIGTFERVTYANKLRPGTSEKYKEKIVTPTEEYADLDDLEMVAYATEIATGEELVGSPVTMRMAILEGWYDKDGSKWKTMPQKMLTYRAASFWTNEYAPEISMGMRTQEEEEEIGPTLDITYEDVTNKPDIVKADIARNGNKTTFNMDSAQVVNEPEKGAEPAAQTDPPQQDPPAPAEDPDKPADTLAKVGQENAKKDEAAKTAEANVKPSFGQSLFNK